MTPDPLATGTGISACVIVVSTLLVPLGCRAQFGGDQPDVLLNHIRSKVSANEQLASTIKMNYTASIDYSGELKARNVSKTGRLRATDQVFTHMRGVWAQRESEGKQHSTLTYMRPEGEIHRETVTVLTGEVMKTAELPEKMSGGVLHQEKFDWRMETFPVLLGHRPFEGEDLLSEVLVPDLASVREGSETIDGRTTFVVDVKYPQSAEKGVSYYGRIWIDQERAIPAKLAYYTNHPEAAESAMITVDNLRFHVLANGCWIPIAGISTLFLGDGTRSSIKIEVDMKSVTTRKEDIPDNLFDIEFPRGAKIYNEILGIPTSPK